MVTSDFKAEVEIRPLRACAIKLCNITLIYGRIAEIFTTLRKLGSRNTMVTWKYGDFAYAQPKICNIALIYIRIAKIFAT